MKKLALVFSCIALLIPSATAAGPSIGTVVHDGDGSDCPSVGSPCDASQDGAIGWTLGGLRVKCTCQWQPWGFWCLWALY